MNGGNGHHNGEQDDREGNAAVSGAVEFAAELPEAQATERAPVPVPVATPVRTRPGVRSSRQVDHAALSVPEIVSGVDLPPAAQGVQEGTVLSAVGDARYEVLGEIAQGGMATIYLARTVIDGVVSEIVLKRLPPELQSRGDFVSMFRDEGTIGARLDHPNLVPVTDTGTLHDSMFLAMPLVRGVSLAMFRQAVSDRGLKMPIRWAINIGLQCLLGLEFAHALRDAQGRPLELIHRDISPENILISYDGVVKLLDFGVSKARYRTHQTAFGLLKGKFGYMAPEQVLTSPVDQRLDLFALSTVLYELIADEHPFAAASPILQIQKIVESPALPLDDLRPEVPAALNELLLKGLAKDPMARQQNASEMRRALERVSEQPIAEASLHDELGRGVRDLFQSRIRAEQDARAERNDLALITALQTPKPKSAREGDVRAQPKDHDAAIASDGRDPGAPKTQLLTADSLSAMARPEVDVTIRIPSPPPAPPGDTARPASFPVPVEAQGIAWSQIFALMLALFLLLLLSVLVHRAFVEEALPTRRVLPQKHATPPTGALPPPHGALKIGKTTFNVRDLLARKGPAHRQTPA